MDQSRSQCPLLKKKDTVLKEEGKAKENKYDVKPPRDLRSKYLIKVNDLSLYFLINKQKNKKVKPRKYKR